MVPMLFRISLNIFDLGFIPTLEPKLIPTLFISLFFNKYHVYLLLFLYFLIIF